MKKIVLFVAFVVVVGGLRVDLVVAAEREEVVAANCEVIKSRMDRVQKKDALARVSMGRYYENILSKMMTPMNARLALNQKDVSVVGRIVGNYDEALGWFRKNYAAYEDEMGRVLAINCSKKPGDFYEGLETLRLTQTAVRSGTEILNELIVDYRAKLVEIGGEL